jgi:general secretion pathway protein D
MITGLLDHEETKSQSGIPGLANLPVIGYAFGLRTKTGDDNELLIVVTPRRMSDHLRESKPLFAGRGSGTSTSAPAPAAPEP